MAEKASMASSAASVMQIILMFLLNKIIHSILVLIYSLQLLVVI